MKADVYRHYLFINKREISTKKSKTAKECIKIVADDVINIWENFSFPHIGLNGVCIKVERLVQSALKENKIPIARRNDEFYEKFKRFDDMFDICTCNCYEKKISIKDYRCQYKIEMMEWESFIGQKERRNQLGPIDRVKTNIIRRTNIRMERLSGNASSIIGRGKGRVINIDTSVPSTSTEGFEVAGDEILEIEDSNNDKDYVEEVEQSENLQNRFAYRNLAITADRFRVSSRAAAALVNAALKDMGLLNESNLIDRKKVERERKRVGKESVICNKNENMQIECLGFDERKDNTKFKNEMEHEEHYVLVKEPGDIYVTHVTPDNGTARCISEDIITYLIDSGSIDSLKALLCDGAPVNTGKMGGVLRFIEIHLQRPIQWLICLLHANELPFRHVLQKIDGKPTGPQTFQGNIGRAIQKDLTKCSITNFRPVVSKIKHIPEDIVMQLSTDQKYLYDMCFSIHQGHVTPLLASKSPGALHHFRWLTTANRILRLYVSEQTPGKPLEDIVCIIMHIYAPGWFWIKSHPKATDGANNFWYLMNLLKGADKEYEVILKHVLQKNSYFAHPENILLGMITDDRKVIRELAVSRIMQAREHNSTERAFQLPKTLNFDSEDYSLMIDWEREIITQPLLIKDYSNAEICNIANEPVKTKFPCHSQGVER